MLDPRSANSQPVLNAVLNAVPASASGQGFWHSAKPQFLRVKPLTYLVPQPPPTGHRVAPALLELAGILELPASFAVKKMMQATRLGAVTSRRLHQGGARWACFLT